MEELIFRRRWLIPSVTISWLVTAQYFNLLPKRYRACCTHLLLFNLPKHELKAIVESNTYLDDKVKQEMMICHLSQKHNFILIHMDDNKVFLNFNKVL